MVNDFKRTQYDAASFSRVNEGCFVSAVEKESCDTPIDSKYRDTYVFIYVFIIQMSRAGVWKIVHWRVYMGMSTEIRLHCGYKRVNECRELSCSLRIRTKLQNGRQPT